MIKSRKIRWSLALSILALAFPLSGIAQEHAARFASAPREFHATLHSIGIEWDLSGDKNHNAKGTVRFREEGAKEWQPALDLLRIDYHYPAKLTQYKKTHTGDEPDRWNMLAGSLFFLEPDRVYEVDLLLRDPDGGEAQFRKTIRTRAEPVVPKVAPRYVIPGKGGGTGSKEAPFRGLDAAEEHAKPGDLFLLGPGEYGQNTFRRGGKPGQPIYWTANPATGDAVLTHAAPLESHVHFEGITFRKKERDPGFRRGSDKNLSNIVIQRCRFEGYNYAIAMRAGDTDWTVLDNTIRGDNNPGKSDFSGEGIELQYTSGHAIGYNRISHVADGVSYPCRNCDIYGNDISDTSDDGIEPDYGYANNRIWGNRIQRVHTNGLSFQPQFCGPWYFLYNQVVINKDGEGVFKFNGLVDRNVAIHNTFVDHGGQLGDGNPLTSFFSRNNLYITTAERFFRFNKHKGNAAIPPSSFYAVDWRSDLDHDGFVLPRPSSAAFSWRDKNLGPIADLHAVSGIEKNGHDLDLSAVGDLGRDRLTLPKDSPARGVAVRLPNVQPFGEGPLHLGAHQDGHEHQYGPRE